MDHTDRLRRLAISDERVTDEVIRGGASECSALDPKTLALLQLAALVGVGGAVPSYGVQVDEAVNAGASAAEIVDVLVGVMHIVGVPSVVAAAPSIAMALGYDLDDPLEP